MRNGILQFVILVLCAIWGYDSATAQDKDGSDLKLFIKGTEVTVPSSVTVRFAAFDDLTHIERYQRSDIVQHPDVTSQAFRDHSAIDMSIEGAIFADVPTRQNPIAIDLHFSFGDRAIANCAVLERQFAIYRDANEVKGAKDEAGWVRVYSEPTSPHSASYLFGDMSANLPGVSCVQHRCSVAICLNQKASVSYGFPEELPKSAWQSLLDKANITIKHTVTSR